MSVQDGYREDAQRHAEQCSNYDIVLTGINEVAGTDSLIVGYKYKGERYRTLLQRGVDIATAIRTMIKDYRL